MWKSLLNWFGLRDDAPGELEAGEMVSQLLRERRQRDTLTRSIERTEEALKRQGVVINSDPKLF